MYSLNSLIEKLQTLFENDASGHDAEHSLRVYRLACRIADMESCDRDIVVLASLLHDADDVKLFSTENYANARSIMTEEGIPGPVQERVIEIISTVSFKGTDTQVPKTIEGMIVQDADRLDAIGAIGIGRAFAFGGNRGRRMYDPDEKPRCNLSEAEYRAQNGTTLNHFYEKLFLLKGMMNTKTARRIAEQRDWFMHTFVDEFLDEWNGKK